MKLRDDNSHVRLLGYLIALELIKKSSGPQQVDVAEQILSGLGIDKLVGVDDLSQEHLALEVWADSFHVRFFSLTLVHIPQKSDDASLGKYIVTKPNGKTTLCWMQIAVVAAMARIPCPTGAIHHWLLEAPKVSKLVVWDSSIIHLESSVKPKGSVTCV
jgi:hypothetical protein